MQNKVSDGLFYDEVYLCGGLLVFAQGTNRVKKR